MKTLLLLRHGKSSSDDDSIADHDRPLNARGKEASKRIGRLLVEEHLVPDLILSSTALRARATAEKVAKKSHYSHAIELEPRLYLARAATWFEVLRHVPQDRERLLAAGHNPGISDFLSRLIGDSEELTTAALAHVELDIKRWADLGQKTKGRLVKLWRPRELD